MNLDTATYCYKTKNLIAIDRLAATCQLIVNTFQIAVDDQYVFIDMLLWQARLVQHKVGSTLSQVVSSSWSVALLYFYVAVDNCIDIQFA